MDSAVRSDPWNHPFHVDSQKRRERFGVWTETDLGDVHVVVAVVGEAGELLGVEEAEEDCDGDVDVLLGVEDESPLFGRATGAPPPTGT